jgi:Flp pilus assembly protein protease CpaA
LPQAISSLITWVWAHPQVILPLFFSLWMAWTDVRTHRIPNLLNLFCALAGLGYQMGAWGLHGLEDGLLGLLLGFVLMIGFYLLAGMGAGDVKALAALGAWLGPWNTFLLFILMGLSGFPLVIVFLWHRGLLFDKIRRFWSWVSFDPRPPPIIVKYRLLPRSACLTQRPSPLVWCSFAFSWPP